MLVCHIMAHIFVQMTTFSFTLMYSTGNHSDSVGTHRYALRESEGHVRRNQQFRALSDVTAPSDRTSGSEVVHPLSVNPA